VKEKDSTLQIAILSTLLSTVKERRRKKTELKLSSHQNQQTLTANILYKNIVFSRTIQLHII